MTRALSDTDRASMTVPPFQAADDDTIRVPHLLLLCLVGLAGWGCVVTGLRLMGVI